MRARIPVEFALLGGLEGDVAQPNADIARLVGDVERVTILENKESFFWLNTKKYSHAVVEFMIQPSCRSFQERNLTFSGNKQCAAVRTFHGEMATPPQNG